ncbi:hypothetical protein KBC99_02895 [Candidatus Saccharibacteria bacterium]|nr:hypothetical protein [Candidatus Saccharibacteria bacterium]
MQIKLYTPILASGYGCDNYGQSTAYNVCSDDASGQLADTGMNVFIFLIIAITSILLAGRIIWRTFKRPQ